MKEFPGFGGAKRAQNPKKMGIAIYFEYVIMQIKVEKNFHKINQNSDGESLKES